MCSPASPAARNDDRGKAPAPARVPWSIGETIGIRFMLAKSLQALVVPWRNNTWRSVETADSASPHRAGAIRLNVENTRKNASGAIPRTFPGAASAPPQGAKNNVQTNTYARRAGGSQIRFILPNLKSAIQRPICPAHNQFSVTFSRHRGQRESALLKRNRIRKRNARSRVRWDCVKFQIVLKL